MLVLDWTQGNRVGRKDQNRVEQLRDGAERNSVVPNGMGLDGTERDRVEQDGTGWIRTEWERKG